LLAIDVVNTFLSHNPIENIKNNKKYNKK